MEDFKPVELTIPARVAVLEAKVRLISTALKGVVAVLAAAIVGYWFK